MYVQGGDTDLEYNMDMPLKNFSLQMHFPQNHSAPICELRRQVSALNEQGNDHELVSLTRRKRPFINMDEITNFLSREAKRSKVMISMSQDNKAKRKCGVDDHIEGETEEKVKKQKRAE